MNKYKQCSIILLSIIIILICTMPIISAASDNSNNTGIEKQIDKQSEIQSNTQKTNEPIKTENKTTAYNNTQKTNTQKTIKNSKLTVNKTKKANNNQKEVIINNSNYEKYFDEYGYALDNQLENSTVILTGQFQNKSFYIYDVSYNITGRNAYLNNSLIEVSLPSIKISNITINNDDTHNSAIVLFDNNCTIENCTIIYDTASDVKALYIVGNGSTIENNNITVGGPSDEIDWYSDPDLARTLAIAIVSNNNTIRNNNITTYNTISKMSFGAIESITIQGSIKGDKAQYNIVEYNNIYTKTTDYAYGVNLGQNINNNIIRYNNITTEGNLFADSIQIFSAASNIIISHNNINTKSNNMSDGIAISKDNMIGKTQNNTISNNNITVTGTYSTLIDIGNLNNSIIKNNFGIINGEDINGIVITGTSNNITENYVKVNSTSLSDTGILLKYSSNNQITNNSVITNTDYSIKLENSYNNTVQYNQIRSKNKAADESIFNDSINNIAYNANKKINTTVNVSNAVGLFNGSVNLSCVVVDEFGSNVTGGAVVFKINGITIKDEFGNPIYTNVTNGSAILKDFIIPSNWKNREHNISAVYSGTNTYNSYRTATNATLTTTNNYNTNDDDLNITKKEIYLAAKVD